MMAIAQQPSLVWGRGHRRQDFILAYVWLFWMKIVSTGVVFDDVPRWMALLCKFAHKCAVLEAVSSRFVPMAEESLKRKLKWTGVSNAGRCAQDMELELMGMVGDAWPKDVFELVYGPARDALSAYEREGLGLPQDHRAVFLDSHVFFVAHEALDVVKRAAWRKEHMCLLSKPPRPCILTEPPQGLKLPQGSPDPDPDLPAVKGVISEFSEDPWTAFLNQWAACVLAAFKQHFCGHQSVVCCKSCEVHRAAKTDLEKERA